MKIHTLALAPLLIATSLLAQEAPDAAPPSGETQPLTYVQYPSHFWEDNLTTSPELYLRFNAPVPLAAAKAKLVFTDREHRQVPAAVSQPTEEEILQMLVAQDRASEGANGVDASLYLRVQPLSPLPPGDYWQLTLNEGLASENKSHALSSDSLIWLGTIRKFSVYNIEASNPFDGERQVAVYFNKSLHEEFNAETLKEYLSLSPAPEDLSLSVSGSAAYYSGSFKFGEPYHVSVKPGIIARDLTMLNDAVKKEVTFTPNDGFVALPAFETVQNRNGHRQFEIQTGNLESVTVKVKKLTARELLFAMRGYEAYEGWGSSRSIPFDMVPGATIFSKDFEISAGVDETEVVTLNWDEVLGDSSPGAVYLCAEGKDKNVYRHAGAQCIVQLSDIGLAWKQEAEALTVYAFSYKTGDPLPGVTINLFDEDYRSLHATRSNDQGVATIPTAGVSTETRHWIQARKGAEIHAIPFTEGMYNIYPWAFDISYSWEQVTKSNPDRRCFIFSDRPLYKPGETLHLKAITRQTDGDSLLSPDNGQGATAMLRVYDPQHRTVEERLIDVSARGSLEAEVKLPEEPLGWYYAEIDFNGNVEPDDRDYSKIYSHSFQLAEYRPNTFEISLDTPDEVTAVDSIKMDVSARYLMGKHLSKADLNWYAAIYKEGFHPESYSNFQFGDRTLPYEAPITSSGTVTLDGQGKSSVEIALPAVEDTPSPGPCRVGMSVEITDLNQQTLAESVSTTVQSSSYYLGIRDLPYQVMTGAEIPFAFVAVNADGSARGQETTASLLIEKEEWITYKVKGTGGAITSRNERKLESFLNEQVVIPATPADHPEDEAPLTAALGFTATKPGNYIATLTSEDEAGHPVLSRIRFEVYVAEERDEFTWEQDDGMRLEVTPDKETYLPGETAKLLVKSQIEGSALVTVERAGVRKVFTRPLDGKSNLIEIPIDKDLSPNVFVSVMVVRGLENSTHDHPNTDYRIGYCQLEVADPSQELHVNIDAPEDSVRPGDEVTLKATVMTGEDKPLPNTEVTLYVVDEGVLQIAGYETPDPFHTMRAPFPLQVFTGQSISDLLPESPEDLVFGNKGYVIGGGGEDGMMPKRRKDFRPVAYWNGSLVSDENGVVTATFTVPDSLSEYRIMAVANGPGGQFGNGESSLVVNKPLMFEPSLPAFSNVGDEILLQGIVHNQTDQPQRVELEIVLDSKAEFVSEPFPIQPTSPDANGSIVDAMTRRTAMDIAAGESKNIAFKIRALETGDAKWLWNARSLTDESLSDRTESTLRIGYPVPILRATKNLTFKNTEAQANALASIEDRLLNGEGSVRVTFSNSLLLEAEDALDYLLHYPYGCVEQTTSSTLPWLSTFTLRDAVPSLKKPEEEVKKAIAHGTNRLLSMQTAEGGLSYWPGGTEPMLWGSAYGGMALAMAQQAGFELPEYRLSELWRYLSSALRNTGDIDDAYDLSQRCLALYTLALAGKAEPAYYDVLYKKRQILPREARALLAAAMLESQGAEKVKNQVLVLLDNSSKAPGQNVPWYKDVYTDSTQILAWTLLDPMDPATTDLIRSLINKRGPHRGWGSTYSNAWPLLALSRYSEATAKDLEASTITLRFQGETRQLDFGNALQSGEFSFPFSGDLRNKPMQLETSTGMPVYAHVEVESRPKVNPVEAVERGFKIHRAYQKVNQTGDLSPATDLQVGDLVQVSLEITTDGKQYYLAIDDPLPAVLEAVNPEFTSRAAQDAPDTDSRNTLYCNFRELRKDRALFFADYIYEKGKYQVNYLARVVSAGTVMAPPAKVEAMYEPERYGLSAAEIFTSQPLKDPAAQLATAPAPTPPTNR